MNGSVRFALFHGAIVTANGDGTIPLDAKMVTRINLLDTHHDLLMQMIRQANAYAEQQGEKAA